jgi:hypothetical protein
MAENKDLKVDELNFDQIKSNFKNYLRSQDEFRDYNFEGSGLSVLLDILSYNTYYNAFYLNMAQAENFLSTAQKRNSVVHLARSLNYTPRSRTSATITGTVTLSVTGSPASVTIPQYTEFTGTIDGVTYTFLNTEAVIIFPTSGVYSGTITLTEGKYVSRRYTVNTADAEQRFLIPNTTVDTSTINVRVLNSSSDSTSRTFTLAEDITEVRTTSVIYFLQEVEDNQYEVRFGDGVFGVALQNGNVVVLEYLISKGSDANQIQVLNYADSISGVTGATFTAADPASGGAERESIQSIKFNAPKNFEAQNRAVTTEDYVAILSRESNVDSVVVWGGEDNDPPTFGKVFIAIKPVVGDVLTATEKNVITESVLKTRKVLTVTTEVVDPEYIYLLVNATVKFDSRATTLSSPQVQSIVNAAIQAYNDDDINRFSRYFRYSKLSRQIDFSERSITNSELTIQLRKEVPIQLGVPTRYEINFSNPINSLTLGRPANHPFGAGNQITSNAFTYAGNQNCFIEDNNGIIRIYQVVGLTRTAIVSNAGTVDYTTGKVILTNFVPTAFADGTNTLKLTANPAEKDILPLRNQILVIRDADITVNMVDDNSINLVNR